MVDWAIDMLRLCRITTMPKIGMGRYGIRRPFSCGRTFYEELYPEYTW